ncbi:MAG: hypothetical protein WCG84_01730 [Candidatus Moraniibacteriota bacterium]
MAVITMRKRAPALEEIDLDNNRLVAAMKNQMGLRYYLNSTVFDLIDFLLSDHAVEEDWVAAADHHRWDGKPSKMLIKIINLVSGHLYGHILVASILDTNKLFLEDFERLESHHFRGVNFYTFEMIVIKVQQLGVYFDRPQDGNSLVARFINAISELLKSHTLSEWQERADTYEWHKINPWFLRILAMSICDHEYGYVLLKKIIPLEVLHLEDYDRIAQHLNDPQVKWEAKLAVWSVAKAFRHFDYGKAIIDKIEPPVQLPPVNYRDKAISVEKINHILTNSDWLKIMRGWL